MKVTIDVILKGYSLHLTFCWSIRFLGTIWSTIALHVLLYTIRHTNRHRHDVEFPEIQPHEKSEQGFSHHVFHTYDNLIIQRQAVDVRRNRFSSNRFTKGVQRLASFTQLVFNQSIQVFS